METEKTPPVYLKKKKKKKVCISSEMPAERVGFCRRSHSICRNPRRCLSNQGHPAASRAARPPARPAARRPGPGSAEGERAAGSARRARVWGEASGRAAPFVPPRGKTI